MPETVNENRCRCPICGARQDWSSQCRRCSGDLTLLREVAAAAETVKRNCLFAIAQGRYQESVVLAKSFVRLQPERLSKRMLAVCYLMCHDFRAAVTLAKSLESE